MASSARSRHFHPLRSAGVRAVRMIKSPAEIALMQLATDITIAAYRHTYPRIQRGMTPAEIGAIMNQATTALGGRPEFALVLLGEASAYPHGTGKPQAVKDGRGRADGLRLQRPGLSVDVSRTFVFGEPTKRQRQVWTHMHRGSRSRSRPPRSAPCRKRRRCGAALLHQARLRPDYKLPGLSHRHRARHRPRRPRAGELRPGREDLLAPGMCFSDEPGIYIPGEFGIRLEDCLYMTASRPRWFSTPPPSIDRPFG
jgi:Xaa-Pro dipeptidase